VARLRLIVRLNIYSGDAAFAVFKAFSELERKDELDWAIMGAEFDEDEG